MEFKTQTNAQNLENAEIVKSATPAEIVKSETPDKIKKCINYDDLIIDDDFIDYDEIIFNSVRIANNHITSKNLYNVINNLSFDIEYLFIDYLFYNDIMRDAFYFKNLPCGLKKVFIRSEFKKMIGDKIYELFKLPFNCDIIGLNDEQYKKMVSPKDYIKNMDCRVCINNDEYMIFNINATPDEIEKISNPISEKKQRKQRSDKGKKRVIEGEKPIIKYFEYCDDEDINSLNYDVEYIIIGSYIGDEKEFRNLNFPCCLKYIFINSIDSDYLTYEDIRNLNDIVKLPFNCKIELLQYDDMGQVGKYYLDDEKTMKFLYLNQEIKKIPDIVKFGKYYLIVD